MLCNGAKAVSTMFPLLYNTNNDLTYLFYNDFGQHVDGFPKRVLKLFVTIGV